MSLNEIAKNKLFEGLTDPYTGKPMTVRVIASGTDMPMYFSPDAFDPSIPVESLEKLLELAGTRNGVSGSKSGGSELECPYTGKRMAIVKTARGFRLTGGFCPSCPVRGAAEFNYAARMRAGVPAVPAPDQRVKIEFPKDVPVPAPVSDGTPKDYALEHAEDALKDILPRKVSVSMSTKKRGKV